ncbi:ubiquitin-like-specific protease 1D [Citrus sinensis]|uniref:Ubiquitin-like-specific protease 1D n=1 Tax=Citrus sinensis TaxID=2711 RepID=A0ACB8LIM8_CITSI|nr:ubiquitin-like-specific protease 1D [Citrus sinensis]
MEEQAENRNKRKLNIDWEEVLPGRNDDVPAELIVKKSGPPTPAQKSVPMSDDPGSGEELDRQIPDQELGVRIARMKDTYSKVRHCLPDKGKKILATVTRLEKECERRRLAGAVPVCLDIDGCDKLTQSPSSGVRTWASAKSRPRGVKKSKQEQNLVLLDEDESPVEDASEESEGSLHIETTEQADEFAECMIDAKIYYPSRVDPESVEICYTDINHLAPAAYLTSPIMNFYIRYLQLQASPTNRAIRDCHFFNTYFYRFCKPFKLESEGNIETARASVHWSLVIICIPDKEDESGPIILHLDSLKLHCSLSIFSNIRSFLKEEWNYLKQEVSPSDLPIAERIWQHLPRRIDDRIIPVPQQKNDYDCGLFVLFFMERFMEEAPERLKKKDLAMVVVHPETVQVLHRFSSDPFNLRKGSDLNSDLRAPGSFKPKQKQILKLFMFPILIVPVPSVGANN